ncbi:lipopolysaccharide biosynthesis protein [Nitrosomonas sp.]|uniref:lipopolysaccharide biosynthesis protein n=1 Tax=Nitrosomonas sp. TaxID=42353 RepID=UPI0025F8E122|nr:lipopolysaccharide biosynthesis protein [Nitrosomonas sp.]MCC6916354.1 lipopolysaccharide biosynthesis protein [Nitrosomonas sp.]
MTAREQVLTGLKWTAGGKLGAQIITWAITLIVMRLLTPDDYGLLAMATVFIAFMLMLSEAGLGPALIQKQDLDEASLRSVFAIVIIANIGLLLLFNLLAPTIADFFNEDRLIPILRVLSLQFLLKIFDTLPGVQLYRQLRFRSLSLINFSTTIAGSVLTLLMAFAQFGVWALILGNLFSATLNVIAINIAAPVHLAPRFSLTGMRHLLSFGRNVTLSRILWFFFTQADTTIIGKLLGKETLGFYSISMQLASLPVQKISSIINQVAFPVFSRIQDDPGQFRNFILKAARILALVTFPVLWGISSIASEMVPLLLGEKWSSAILPLQLLALVMPLRMLANFLPSAVDALGRPDVTMRNVLLASIIMPIAFLVGCNWGLEGVALSWAIVYPLVFFINIQRMLLVIELRLSDFFYAITPAMGATIGMYLAVWTTATLLADNVDQWIKLLVMITAGMLAYAGLTLLFNKRGYHEVIDLVRR